MLLYVIVRCCSGTVPALAAMPLDVNYSRATFIEPVTTATMMFAAYFVVGAVQERRERFYYVGAFILGLAFMIKLWQGLLPARAFALITAIVRTEFDQLEAALEYVRQRRGNARYILASDTCNTAQWWHPLPILTHHTSTTSIPLDDHGNLRNFPGDTHMAMVARPAVLVDALIPSVWVQTRAQRIAADFVLMFGFAWFVALFAQMAIRLPWTPVPITGQTFAVLVAGGALGANRGAGSLLIYMLMGMIGIPVFAPGSDALAMDGTWGAHFLLPWVGSASLPWAIASGGYIVGFILAAWVTGFFAERLWDRKPLGLLAMLAGNVILYVPGLLWLYADVAGRDWAKTLEWGLYPFIVGDLMKLYLATLTLPAAWALVGRLKNE